MSISTKRFRANVSCPICFEVRRGTRIYICVNGHSICADCKGKLGGPAAKCPTGECAYYVPPTRNRAIESLIADSLIVFPCKNEAGGCFVNGTGKDLDKHEIGCLFRKVPCPMSCFESCKFIDLLDHLTTVHEIGKCVEIANGQEALGAYCLKVHQTARTLLIVRAVEGEKFIFCVKPEGGLYYAWAQILGHQDKADKFSVRIRVEGRNEFVHQMSCKVHPVDSDDDDITNEVGQGCPMTN